MGGGHRDRTRGRPCFPMKPIELVERLVAALRRENDEYVEMGDWLIVVGRWIGTAKGSGVPIDQRTVNAVRIRDSQVVEWVWSLPDKQAAVDYVQRHTNEFSRSQMNATPEPR